MSADAAREASEALLAHLDRFRWACLTNSAAGSYTRDTTAGLTDLYRLKNELRAALAAPRAGATTPGGAERVASLRPVQEIVQEIVADVMADDEASADHGRRQP